MKQKDEERCGAKFRTHSTLWVAEFFFNLLPLELSVCLFLAKMQLPVLRKTAYKNVKSLLGHQNTLPK